MDWKKLFTTRKFGLTLDEFLAISVACIFATMAENCFPVKSLWLDMVIFFAVWIVGFLIYSIIKALVIIQYEKTHPQEKDAFDDIYDEFEKNK